MTAHTLDRELLACPFCGAQPHRLLGKVKHDQLHGERYQDIIIRCPKRHAEVCGPSENFAVLEWNNRASAAPVWRPISTAPKDGTAIWVCNKHYTANGFLPLSVRWKTYHPNAKGDPYWRDIYGHKIANIEFWMPLPAAPQDACIDDNLPSKVSNFSERGGAA